MLEKMIQWQIGAPEFPWGIEVELDEWGKSLV